MVINKMIWQILILACGCLCLGAVNAFADTIMIPIDFGEALQSNIMMISKSAHKRDTYKTVADVSFGVGGGLAAIGLGLVLLDKLYLEPNSQNLYRAEGVKFQFDVHNDGVQAGLTWQF